jgi:hypothetical protein
MVVIYVPIKGEEIFGVGVGKVGTTVAGTELAAGATC